MLEISALRKSFDGQVVLDGLDILVGAGEAVALLGGNGSGKTTTLRCIAGLIIPDSGRVEVGGHDAVGDGPVARHLLSYMPQRSAFPPTLTVREAITLIARLRRLPTSRADEEIGECGLEGRGDKRVETLSGGQRQRLALAVALLPDVRLYLFDEPSANLDTASLEIFRRRAVALARDGRTVLFTTHSREDVEAVASRVVCIDQGRRVSDDLVAPPSTTHMRLVSAR
jgi:ABC-type multidrug transport system ATPase subunit